MSVRSIRMAPVRARVERARSPISPELRLLMVACAVAIAAVEVLSSYLSTPVLGSFHGTVLTLAVLVGLGVLLLGARHDARCLSSALAYAGLYTALIICGMAGSYFVAALGFANVDRSAVALDRALRFDWRSFMGAVDTMPVAVSALRLAYASVWLQGFVILSALCIVGQFHHAERFLLSFAICLAGVLALNALMPVVGTRFLFPGQSFANLTFGGMLPASYLVDLHAGLFHVADVGHSRSLLALPSLPAAMAVLWPYAAWKIRPLLPLAIVLNIALFVSVLTEGGHYLVGALAGAAVAALSIAAVERVMRDNPRAA